MVHLPLTPRQILEIYEAGIRRGRDEATAHDWGERARGDQLAELEDALVWSDCSGFMAEMDYDERLAWWGEFRAKLALP